MKNILLIVDMQKGFARYEQTLALNEKILELLKLKVFDSVVATRFLNDNNSIYEQLLNWKRLKKEEERDIDARYIKFIDVIFDKYIYNCVNDSFIQKLCQLNEGKYPEKVFIVGADTDCCVLTTATTLFEHNIRPVVLTSYCASNGGDKSHEAGVLCMKRLIGKGQLVDIEIDKTTDINEI